MCQNIWWMEVITVWMHAHLRAFIQLGACVGIFESATAVQAPSEPPVAPQLLVKSEAKLATVGTVNGSNALWSQFPIHPDLRLVFTGNITRIPLKGALPVCNVFGQQFYMVASGEPLSKDDSSPAWYVETCKPSRAELSSRGRGKGKGEVRESEVQGQGQGQGQESKNEHHLNVVKNTAPMTYCYNDFLSQKKVECDVTFYSLVPNPYWKPDKDPEQKFIQLTRIPIASQIKVTAPRTAKGKGKSSQGAWNFCRHLLR